MSTIITEPGVYDIDEATYHGHKQSLSASGSKKLLPPSCPAKFRWELDHGQPHKAVFDFGHVAHKLVLGSGPEIAPCDYPDWKTKAARDEREAAYAAGKVPCLTHEYATARDMAAAIRKHPIASMLFDPEWGTPEQSLFRRDPETGVLLRSRFDVLRNDIATGARLIIPDYKSCLSAEPGKVSKAVHDYGYHRSGAWYIDMAVGLNLHTDAVVILVFQEKTAPYLVTVVELDTTAIEIGRDLNRKAIDLYAKCVANDQWPGYADDQDIPRVSLPVWAERRHFEENL